MQKTAKTVQPFGFIGDIVSGLKTNTEFFNLMVEEGLMKKSEETPVDMSVLAKLTFPRITRPVNLGGVPQTA